MTTASFHLTRQDHLASRLHTLRIRMRTDSSRLAGKRNCGAGLLMEHMGGIPLNDADSMCIYCIPILAIPWDSVINFSLHHNISTTSHSYVKS